MEGPFTEVLLTRRFSNPFGSVVRGKGIERGAAFLPRAVERDAIVRLLLCDAKRYVLVRSQSRHVVGIEESRAVNGSVHCCRTVWATFVNDGEMRSSAQRRTIRHCWHRAVMYSAFAAARGQNAAAGARGKERRDQRQTDEQQQRNGNGAAHGRYEIPARNRENSDHRNVKPMGYTESEMDLIAIR